MAKRKKARRSSSSSRRHGASKCVKASDCGMVVAESAFRSAKTCSAKQAAADAFRAVAARKFRGVSKAEKSKLYRAALRMQARAAAMCGNEAKAARIQAALSTRDSSESRHMDPAYAGGFEGWRRKSARGMRGRRRSRSKRYW